MRRRGRAKVIRFEDGSYGRIIVERTSIHTTRKYTITRKYIDFMYDKLLEWLEDNEVWYDDLDEMIEHAEDYIYERLLEAPEDVIPCDQGKLSIGMFTDYIFNDRLWTDQDIANGLVWVFEPEDIEDMRYVVECYDELREFRNTLKSMIKVKAKGGDVA